MLLQALRTAPALGLMLANNAFNQPDITLLSVLPETLSPPVAYHAEVLASDAMPEARDFIAYLRSPEAQMIFHDFGFQPPEMK
jgi:ABC-type molybdate transport system substrate-binding protein